MDLDGLVADVYLRLGVPAGDALHTTASIEAWVNHALQEIDSEQDWPWNQVTATITTAANDGSYPPPAGWTRTRTIRVADDIPMERYSLDGLDDLYADPTETGYPAAYAIEGEQLLIRPIPDGVYSLTHSYVAGEVELTGGTDEPLMPARFHAGIAALAAHTAMGRSREDARSGAALADYQRIEAKMLRHKRRFKGPARIRSRW